MTSVKTAASLKFAGSVGMLLIVSGLIHTVAWFVSGTSWEGATSLRKPILFGLSTGVTILSVAWVTTKLPNRRFDAILLVTFSFSLGIEVFLISLQQWLGNASHFNRTTKFDASVLMAIEILITIAATYILYVTVQTWRMIDSTGAMKLAIRYGMALLVIGCLIGFVISLIGYQQVGAGRNPELFGKRGVLKFPHGIPLHAIQILPSIVAVTEFLGWRRGVREGAVQFVAISLIGFTAFGLLQTFSGRARFEYWSVSQIVLAASLLMGIWFAVAEYKSVRRRWRS